MMAMVGILFFQPELVDVMEHFRGDDDEDEIRNDFLLLLEDYDWVLIILLIICIVFSLVPIRGAMVYQRGMVLTAALWYCLVGIFSLLLMGIAAGVGVFCCGFLAYPHLVLYQEIGEGIMTEDNYPDEMHSCCCVYSERPRMTVKEAIEKKVGVFS
jgi:hypothetical protein